MPYLTLNFCIALQGIFPPAAVGQIAVAARPRRRILLKEPRMATPFLAEIKLVSFNFAPKGWALCNGQFLPINQNQALFSLLGTTYGGNGRVNFALPDLRGRVPCTWGEDLREGKGAARMRTQ